MNLKTEITAGLTTFMTMAYIIFVNPAILSAAGVPFDGAVSATCIAAGILCVAMGIFTGYPYTLAAGMGLNAVLTFNIVLGPYGQTWQMGMAMIFVEGCLVAILVLTNLREMVMNAIPLSLKYAIGVGIGLFIAFIGLKEGGIVVRDPDVLVRLGDLTQPVPIVALLGVMSTAIFVASKLKGAILLGIFATALFAGFFGLISLPQEFVSLPKDFSTFFPFGMQELKGLNNLSLMAMVFCLFMTDFFDTMGTIIGVGEQAGFVTSEGKLPRLKRVLLIDSLGAVLGGLFGCSSNTTYVESAAGVAAGGRTGLTAVVSGSLFLLSLFFIPLVKVIGSGVTVAEDVCLHPVTAPALIIVGFFMITLIEHINFRRYDEAIPSFLTIIIMPLTCNLSTGMGFGFISYTLIKLFTGKYREIHPLLYVVSLFFLISFVFWGGDGH